MTRVRRDNRTRYGTQPNPTQNEMKWFDRTLIMYSMREWEWGSTTASTQMSGLTCVERRYVMRSNSPSGGMKEMVRSFSNLVRVRVGVWERIDAWGDE